MATVLVTGVGGATGVGAVRSLHARTVHDVVGVDMNPGAAGLLLADDGEVVPPATDEAWPDAVAAVVEQYDVDVVVPTVDEELGVLHSLSDSLPAGVSVVAPRQSVIDCSLDKYRTYERLRDAGHSVPLTWSGRDVDDIGSAEFPVVAKPRRGRGSRGVERLDDRAALDAYLDETERALEALLFQEFLEGAEYTTSVVVTSDDRLLAVVPKEAMEKDGSTVLGATRRAPAVAESCRAVARTLEPAGPLNVQQLLDGDGTPHTIEINPRFSSTSCLTVAAGVDEFDLLIRDALGESVDAAGEYDPDRYILRYDDHVFADPDDVPWLE